MEIDLKGHSNGRHFTKLVRGDLSCDACDDRSYSESIFCYRCNFTIHTKCTFVFGIPKRYHRHLSHFGHLLKLRTKGPPDNTDPKCHICGKNTKRILYHCSTCNLNLDIDCIVSDMFARRAPTNMPWHHHPLLKQGSGHHMRCEVCGGSDGNGYFCPTCKLMFHKKCVTVFDSPEIIHRYHVRHSLKLLTNGVPSYTDSQCHVSGKHIKNFLYHCDICKFNLDMVCATEGPPVALSNMKVNEDTLTLIPRLISFVCDACGMKGHRSPYVSLQGGDHKFFHQQCVHLPRVIHVNRHDHRVSYKYPLGRGEWTCKICLEDIDWSYGAYSCSLCPNYALHSKCATRKDVWDGEELDGVPEQAEDSEPFKLNDDNTITHFVHEQHNMRLNNEGKALEESILCEACVCPIGSNTFYKCLSCNFIMHETCANLPKKKRLFLSPRLLSLKSQVSEECDACRQICTKGFAYTVGNEVFDLICCLITVPFIHESHEHPLLYMGDDYGMNSCQNCDSKLNVRAQVLGCIKCNYYLDFKCVTLPSTVRLLRYDDHPLTLCYGEEETSGKYWCDVCETELNPKKWFYTCNDCSVTLHIFCVLGNMIRYAKPGKLGDDGELMLNKTSTRPICYNCHYRCMSPYFFIKGEKSFCSLYCVSCHTREDTGITESLDRPPWIG